VTASGPERMSRHRHAGEVMRARSILAVACALWLATGVPIDLFTHDAIGSGGLGFVLAVRLAASALHAIVLVGLYRTPLPAPRVTDALIASVFPVTALATALIATRMGGLTSPYVSVMFVGIMVQVAALPWPWRRGAALVGATVAVYPLALCAASRFDPAIAAQLADRAARTTFLVFVAVLLAGATIVVWAGHVLWTLRRSVFESRNLGRYRLIRRIGKGGMGEVWRAQDRALRREVALKILSPEHGRHPSAIARFEREIQATSELAHPGVVRIHDWGVTDDGVWYFAMDLLAGVDLETLVARTGPLPPALVVQLGAAAAAGLGEAHRRGVVHRDVKPGNLFVVARDGAVERAVLVDFGIARVEADSELTHPGAVMGTPGYMAPEVRAGAPGGIAADIYGLGAALYFALTGAGPHDTRAVRASALAAGIPLELDDLLARALDPEPARRPASAGELERALAACGLVWSERWPIDRPARAGDVAAAPTVEPDAPPTVAERP